MLYRVFIVCLFLILCIFLIYFALKNKQIETFQDTSKRIIVKTADKSYNNLNIFSYNGSIIAYVNKFDDTAIGLFYDYNASRVVHKKPTDDIIQIINVSSMNSKTVYLKDDGTVYYKHSDGTQYITNLSDIIQIAPNGQNSFIALTSHNTLIHYDVTAAAAAAAANEIALEETDPIVSIQGFQNSTIVMYLTMLGDLKYFNYDSSQGIRIESPILDNLKVIQFSVPTYSEFDATSLPPFSCIALDKNNNSYVKFINIGGSPQLTLTNATMITTLVIKSSVSYECYVVTNDGHLFKFSKNNADYVLTNEKYIDSDVKNVIAVNDTIYYVKNGAINCDSLDTDDEKWFPSTDGDSCVTCGINTEFTQSGKKPAKASDSGGECKCSGGNTHAKKNSDRFNAEYNEKGCRDYKSCPIPNLRCGNGLFSSNIEFPLSGGQGTPDEVTPEALICPICVPCSKTAEEAFQRNPGSIKYGSSHPNNPDNIPYGSKCYNGTSADNCQYYISQTCTPGTDTVFAKRTMWEDLDLDNREQYSVTLAGEVPKFKPTADDTEPRNNASTGSKNTPRGNPATNLNLNVGQDDKFIACTPINDCINLGSTNTTSESFKLVSGTEQRYDCTNGYKRICDNCSDKYECTESIYSVDFKDDSSTDITLNHLLQYCGDRADYTDDFEKFKIGKPDRCPADTSTSVCPGLFSSTPCPIADDFTSCPDLFSSS